MYWWGIVVRSIQTWADLSAGRPYWCELPQHCTASGYEIEQVVVSGNIGYTKRQQRLLCQIQKADKWYNKAPFIYFMYLIPVMFVVCELWRWSLLCEISDYCLAIRIGGKVMPIDINMNRAVLCIILPIGFLLLIMSWMVVSNRRDKQTFKEILEIKKDKDS